MSCLWRGPFRTTAVDRTEELTYPPLNTLKSVADNLWIVDGPIILFGMPWPKLPFPTRMTIARLAGGALFVHSPTPLVNDLKREIERVGVPRWIIGPNRIHHWWLPDWKAAFSEASVYLAHGIREQAGGRIDFDAFPLSRCEGYPWDSEIATLPVGGRYMTEVEFLHRASRTAILTDLIENFEPEKLGLVMRWLTWLAGVQHPNGGIPRDLRLTFDEGTLHNAVKRILAWNPERVIFAHGRWYERNGADELRRAFRRFLDRHE